MKKLARSAGLPAPLPAEASTTEDPPTATTESPRPGMSLRPDPATQGTTRQTTDLDLTSFMASFHPGLASEPRPAAEARGVAAPAAPSSNVLDEMQRLREKLQALRSRVAGVRLSLSVPTEPNDQGELPADSVRQLTSLSFPEQAKKAKGDYHPPQAHVLAATRMFKDLVPSVGKPASPMSFGLGLRESACIGFKTTPAVLMAIFSGRLGSRGLTIPHFREEGEQAALEAGPSNGNFASNFSPSAVLPTAASSCDSYDDILDGIHGLARVGEAMLHNHMLVLTERLRVFVSKNKSADPGCLPARVKLVLLFVNKWLGPALEHVQVDNPAWWTGFSQDVEAIDYKSPEWTMSLVITLSQAAAARPPDSRDQHQNRDGQGRREKSVPDDIRQLIPTNRRGEEPCLRFLGWVMCLGGTRDRCGHHKRIHGWPSADIPRCLKDWAQDTYARRRGWDQVHNQDRRGARS
ncbi:hypothetical protein PF010_g28115 [Phytophthora fragariae]|uniref:Uncharacterized protein n=1 Tax=Phytophthora fragariae TaxID=53985 RepID=A0A6A3HBE6_9STRA|nr:hypothetical protein PF011_g27984 [Phytophthora fragariae]KAE9065647.1 hypothetical protein PF010_g28115 [Phytophthora fragariae]